MTGFLWLLFWFLSTAACIGTARHRNVRFTAARAMLAGLLGPLAIPFLLMAKPERSGTA